MNRVAPRHQANWDWRAACNFIGGGSGAGVLLFAAIAAAQGAPFRASGLLGLVLVGAGLSFVWLEIGRPFRALNVFLHPHTSWMTREAMVASLLFGAGFAALLLGSVGVFWLAAALGMVFLYCQGRMLFASKGIPAWRQPTIVALIMITGLTEGAGVLAAVLPWVAPELPLRWSLASLFLMLVARTVVWRSYLNQLAAAGAPAKSLAVYAGFDKPFIFIGNALPALLAVTVLLAGAGAFTSVLAGILAVAGGWALKFTVVARAAYNQGFALPLHPVRGRGGRLPGIKPGWTPPAG
ncbi:MAG: phenylacetyl-CoA:acceptor oxidoreductase [Betaproteobacteria bacterium]|nr:MAG: phenylacetyl-CoA:acceptor oxidoreductase [Betaproteobacteria bacterium]